MTTPLAKVRGPLRAIAESWDLHLRGYHKAVATTKVYLLSLAVLDDWLRTRVSEATASTRYRAPQQFFKWAVEQGEIEPSPATAFAAWRSPRRWSRWSTWTTSPS
jgi:site-specific recombinase XerC